MAAAPTSGQRRNMDRIEAGFQEIGYSPGKIIRGYRFADSEIELAGFQNTSYDGRSACIGAHYSNSLRGADLAQSRRVLGAPIFLEVQDTCVFVWNLQATGSPKLCLEIASDQLESAIQENRSEWNPEAIFRAKSVEAYHNPALQSSFVDIGFWPAVEKEIRTRLDSLLAGTIKAALTLSKNNTSNSSSIEPQLFKLLFRMLAGKVLYDKDLQDTIGPAGPESLLTRAEDFYGDEIPAGALENDRVKELIWNRLRGSISFRNITPETLAYVYENTLITQETRRKNGTHSTPVGLAEFVVGRLPFETLKPEKSVVFEPCSGHGVFLIAAMKRLKERANLSGGELHEYLKQRLIGMELDSFAVEVSKLGLTLADYPNKDGWKIMNENVFTSSKFLSCVQRADVVLGNPPFEDFEQVERSNLSKYAVQKSAELLHRILEHPPRIIGFVLPHTFIDGPGYREVRKKLAESYDEVEVISLPDNVFDHSDAESAVLLASRGERPSERIYLSSSRVFKDDRKRFLEQYTLAPPRSVPASRDQIIQSGELYLTPLRDVWEYLSNNPKLGDLAEVHRGIQPQGIKNLLSDDFQPGSVPGLKGPNGRLGPYSIKNVQYWKKMEEKIAHKRLWNKRKIIVNANSTSRDPWRLQAAADSSGIICYQTLTAIWPQNGNYPIHYLEAILNGPIANAFMYLHSNKRHNKIEDITRIPLPIATAAVVQQISAKVREISSLLQKSFAPPADNLLLSEKAHDWDKMLKEIDALVLKAYDLPPRLERKVLDLFRHCKLRGPFQFTPYFPENYKSWTPYWEYISEEYQQSTGAAMKAHIPVIDDPDILEALREVCE